MSTYRIKSGDTLWALAHRFGTTVAELARLNGIKNPNLIITGHVLRLPDAFSTGKGRSLTRPSGHKPAVQIAPQPSPAQTAPVAQQPTVTGAAIASSPAALTGVAAQYAHYEAMIKAAGGTFRTGPNQMNLLGLRKDTNTHANGGNGLYDDKLVMLWRDAQGNPRVKFFTYNTEPASAMSAYSDDVNHDGRADQGRIPSGYYEYALSSWKNGFCLRSRREFQVERDMNHDGVFNDGVRTGGGATMLFHEGGRYGTGSAGCQTFPPDQWNLFMNAIRQANGPIGYTLVSQ